MALDFARCDRGQLLLMPPSLTEWLPEDHLVWTVLGAVDQMDLSRFEQAYRLGGAGRSPLDPVMMVALLLYSYARGVRSSRGIERACWEDVAFKVIAGMRTPDHSTIAEFRRRHEAEIAVLFDDVLGLCREAGLVSVGVITIDGTKIKASASMDQNRSYRELVTEILREADEVDRREDELYGQARGDELPEQLRTAEGRRRALADAKRRLAERQGREISEEDTVSELVIEPAGGARAGQASWWQTGVAEGRSPSARDRTGRVMRGNHKPYQPAELPEGVINLSDPDSRVMRTQGTPPRQAYNAQAAVNDRQIVLAAEISISAPDFGHLRPMLDTTIAGLRDQGITETPEVVLADAGYWHTAQMQAIEAHGIEVLAPPDGNMREGQRPGWNKAIYQQMRDKLTSERGRELYAQRKITIEPVFGQIKYNRHIDRFMRRGRAAAQSEWRLITATHNLLKLHSHWIATA